MKDLHVCFVGVGSIARRHIRNLRTVANNRNIDIHIDAFRHNKEKAECVQGIDKVYFDVKDVPETYDVVFITNPTERHLDTLEVFHSKAKHFFIEKPAVFIDQVTNARLFSERKNSIYYVACPLRYCPVVEYIKGNVIIEDVISVRAISSSYLPDWRPGQDYRDTYSAHKDMGGGVGTDLIHEWDYLTYLFGMPQKVLCLSGKKSNLEIDSDDFAIYIAENDDMITELHLDYFGRNTIRELQIITKEDTIIGDLVRQTIAYLRDGRTISFDETRDDYQCKELNHFLDMIDGKATQDNDFYYALNVLMLTAGKVEL